eukprot:TRINITY_DN21405_c0_g1_i1.p1 TRINITY_DN21405_c0_g1~~TRINITY_DN21405_c0_g1_i1.p1  ORF type:complete len:436 (-),score=94.88 TRINITY_DN21405_c0_g1_i1:62-1369(-)
MDKIIGAIQNAGSDEDKQKQLRAYLTKEEQLITKNAANADEALAALDPENHTVGYAFILAAKALSSKMDASKFIATANKFLNRLSPSAKLVINKVGIISRKFTEICIENNRAMFAIKPLRNALQKARPKSDTLTSIHADFLQACLAAKNYGVAGKVLEQEISDVASETVKTTARDVLLFFYYGGLVYIGLKDYRKALTFLRTAVTMPAMALSAVMAESYKKYILLSLIVHGKVSSLPRYTSTVVQKYHKNAFPQYQEFITIYTTLNTNDLHKCAEQHSELFKKDNNFGLVKQCIQALYRRNIQRFTQTYLTFSLQDIASNSNLPSATEAEKQVVRMIQKGEIFATINQENGMVSFNEDPESYDTLSMAQSLDARIQKIISLGQKVRAMDETIACSTSYIQRTAMNDRGRWPSEFGEDFEGAEKALMMSGSGGKLV